MCVQKSVAAYGAFVDIGSTTDGLVHISQLSHSYVKDVNDHISPGQKVNVMMLKVEGENKISLSMKAANPGRSPLATQSALLPVTQRASHFILVTTVSISHLSPCATHTQACEQTIWQLRSGVLCTAETEAEKADRQEREAASGGAQRAPRRGRASAAPQHNLEVCASLWSVVVWRLYIQGAPS